MKINSIENFGYVVTVDRVKMTNQSEKSKRTDKLEISAEARQLAKSKSALTPERLELIKQRIAENFYDQDDVLKEVAERMLKSKELKQALKGPGGKTK